MGGPFAVPGDQILNLVCHGFDRIERHSANPLRDFWVAINLQRGLGQPGIPAADEHAFRFENWVLEYLIDDGVIHRNWVERKGSRRETVID